MTAPALPALDLTLYSRPLTAMVLLPGTGCALVLPSLPAVRVGVWARPRPDDPARPDLEALGWSMLGLWSGDA